MAIKSAGTSQLFRHLLARAQIVGPLTVADFMREVLANPREGYYINKDPLGAQGDFITSPEISPMFGELLGIWFVHTWRAAGSPKGVRFIELGPGRGTLMDNMLTAVQKFPDFTENLQVSLVETSPTLAALQASKLGCGTLGSSVGARDAGQPYASANCRQGHATTWYRNLTEVPTAGWTCLVANEFFDALPVHQFEKTKDGWRERLVDVLDKPDENGRQFRLVLSPQATEPLRAAEVLLCDPSLPVGAVVELSFDGLVAAKAVARHLAPGGAALVVDYGEVNKTSDTLRAFRKHKQVHVFDEPGTADLTCDVNFNHLARALVNPGTVSVHGPVTQQLFLQRMGIATRAAALTRAQPDKADGIRAAVAMLTETMGTRFKVLGATSKAHPLPTLPGFSG
eukprot:m.220958 g.220958  ORF g.220958 m.220958 type:complete len:398 (-) comp15685_c0_seq1:39-1232(-)